MKSNVEGSLGYREILKQKLEERCSANPRYSLRSFARDLGLSPSQLSDVFRGRSGLSPERANQIAGALGLSSREKEVFVTLVDSSHARKKSERDQAQLRLEQIRLSSDEVKPLSLEAFQVISDWYHYGIMELTHLPGFKSDPQWIAHRLGISVAQAQIAIERLLKLELLTQSRGKLKAAQDFVFSPSGIPSEAIKKFHRQTLARAGEALATQSVEERDFSCIVLAMNSKRLPEVKESIKEFRRELHARLSKDRVKDTVYTLAIQFFRADAKTDLTRTSTSSKPQGAQS